MPLENQPQLTPLGTIVAGHPSQIMAEDLVGPLPESEKGNLYYHGGW